MIGTGTEYSVRDCYEIAFECVGLDPADFVSSDKALIRPAEVDKLLANPRKARDELGWVPKTTFRELVTMMVQSDLELHEGASGRRRGGPGTRA